MADNENGKDELVAILGIEVDKQKFKESLNSLKKFSTSLGSLKTGMSLLTPEISGMGMALSGIGAAVATFAAADIFAGKQAKNVADLKKQADVLGITTDQLQALQLASKNSRMDIGQVTGVIGSLRSQLLGFQTGNTPTQLIQNLAKASSLLGVSISPIESTGKIKSAYKLFTQIAVAIGHIHDKTKQAAASQLIFGQNITPLIGQGMGGINRAYESLKGRNLLINPDQIAKMQAFNQQMNLLAVEFSGVKRQLAEGLMPALKGLNHLLSNHAVIDSFLDAIKAITGTLSAMEGAISGIVGAASDLVKGDFHKSFLGVEKASLALFGPVMAAGSAIEHQQRMARLAKGSVTNNNNKTSTINHINIGQTPRSFVPSFAYYGSNR